MIWGVLCCGGFFQGVLDPGFCRGDDQEDFSGKSFFMFAGSQMPLSVIKPVTSLAGVTANA